MAGPDEPIRIEIFKHLFSSVADEMGAALRRSSFSPNIKERLDFSCALFNPSGRMIAQAAHIPVHLGAMPLSVKACLDHLDLHPGDVAIVNDPYHGGTHLPDITLVAPVYASRGASTSLIGYTASRAHHADVGGANPGSMGLTTEIFAEGLVLPPSKLVREGQENRELLAILRNNVRTPDERMWDLRAQLAAAEVGERRLISMAKQYGQEEILSAADGLLAYSERMTRALISGLPGGTYRYTDHLDDDGIQLEPVQISVTIHIRGDQAIVDFDGSSNQQEGGVNAVYAVTLAATYYVFRSLIGLDVPSNSGCLVPIEVFAPLGTVVNAVAPAAVAAGNVETSQRIVDVLLGALAQACPERVPAASQGTMNNLTIGGWDPIRGRSFTYYETLGGGMGARPGRSGASAIHSHMTNTRNTPIEALEFAYPLRVRRYEVRHGSGGAGKYRGGDGLVREVELLHPAQVSILSDRRQTSPYGLWGGEAGAPGRNLLLRPPRDTDLERGERRSMELFEELPAKTSFRADGGSIIRLETPGGGGLGKS